MTRYLISFDCGAMTFPDEDLPDLAKAAHEVVEQAKDAGVWVFGGGVEGRVGTDGPALASKEYLADSRSSTCPHTRRR
jgi:hypothetical protein